MVSLAPSSIESWISKDDPDGESCPIKHRIWERSNHVLQISVDEDQDCDIDVDHGGLSLVEYLMLSRVATPILGSYFAKMTYLLLLSRL